MALTRIEARRLAAQATRCGFYQTGPQAVAARCPQCGELVTGHSVGRPTATTWANVFFDHLKYEHGG